VKAFLLPPQALSSMEIASAHVRERLERGYRILALVINFIKTLS
jgi:hypothetical protein